VDLSGLAAHWGGDPALRGMRESDIIAGRTSHLTVFLSIPIRWTTGPHRLVVSGRAGETTFRNSLQYAAYLQQLW
jgi:hypothetical protein